MQEYIIDKAPGKELIPKIIQDKTFEDLNEFYKIRVGWYGYPLIHDRIVTHGLFKDLTDTLPENADLINTFIDYASEIANRESDKKFLNSIFLILDFCSIGKNVCIPTKTQIQKIIELRPRVQKFSFVSNMSCFWEQILDYCSKDETFDKKLFVVNATDYTSLIDLNFPSIDNNTTASCPVSMMEINKEIQGIVGEYEPLAVVRTAKIDTDKYWVWLYKNITGNVWSWYITVKEDAEGNAVVERHSIHCGVRMTPEKLLLDYHYNS